MYFTSLGCSGVPWDNICVGSPYPFEETSQFDLRHKQTYRDVCTMSAYPKADIWQYKTNDISWSDYDVFGERIYAAVTCPLWVISGHFAVQSSCLLSPISRLNRHGLVPRTNCAFGGLIVLPYSRTYWCELTYKGDCLYVSLVALVARRLRANWQFKSRFTRDHLYSFAGVAKRFGLQSARQ